MDIVRAALYVRVSTEEQVREGYSVEAQKANLLDYAKKKGYRVVDTYIDEGITARKKYTKRKEFMRLLNDVESGKVDVILFIKLDRWFRSVGDYYKIQEILDRNGVNWATTTEIYDTTTANGRLHINIRLAVAQDESDRTSERIKFVFEKKVANGEVITGSAPFGYVIKNKRLVIDEEEKEFVRQIFKNYLKLRTINGVCVAMNKLRDKPLNYNLYARVLNHNLEMYTGKYRGNPNYAPAYLTESEYNEIRAISDSNERIRSSGNTYSYVFSGLLRCGVCGRSFSGRGCYGGSRNKIYYNYRCTGQTGKLCNHKGGTISEINLEKQLLAMIEDEVRRYKVEYSVRKKQKKKTLITRSAVDNKLARLRTLYLNELIEIEEYKEEYEALQEQLEIIEETEAPEETDFSELEKLLQSDFRKIYSGLDNLEKRALWHSVIDEIIIKDKAIQSIKFKQ